MWFKSGSEYFHHFKAEWQSWTPFPVCIPHEHLLVDVEDSLDFWGHFPSLLLLVTSNWCSVSVWERTNLWLQETKPVSFWTAYEGLQNHKLCQNYSAGHIVNWYLSGNSQKINTDHSLSCCGMGLGYLFQSRKEVLHRIQSCVMCSHLQNILAHYSFGSIMYFKEKATTNFENKNKLK